MSRVSVVILNYNGQKMLERFLDNVIACTGTDGEVIVADNASTDTSLDWLASHHPTLRTIVLDRNYGFAEGYNRALRQVDSELYVLLNSDVEVTPGWLAPLTDFMDRHPQAAACQPKLRSQLNKEQFEYAGAAGGYLDRYGYPFCRGRIFSVVETDHGQYDQPAPCLWATGACLMIRAVDYWEAGALDGRFFAHNEEIDLCWRLNGRGRQVWYVPQSTVYHVGGGTLPKGNPRKTFLNFRNNLTMLYKNLPDSDLRHVMRMRFWLDWLAALEALLLQRNPADFMAILRARRAFRAWKADFRRDREAIQRQRTADGRQAISILWKYYVRRQTTFSRLTGLKPLS